MGYAQLLKFPERNVPMFIKLFKKRIIFKNYKCIIYFFAYFCLRV